MTSEKYRGYDSFFKVRVNTKPFSKYAMALRAASLLSEGDSFLIDAGTSLTPLAKIVRRMAIDATNHTHFTIMTHNNGAFQALLDTPPNARFNVFHTGGRYDRDLNASFGQLAEMAYRQFNPKWIFIGQNGLEAHKGLFCHGNTEELTLKKEIFSMPAYSRVILSDFEKIGHFGGLLFGASSDLTANVEHCKIITDDIHDKKFGSEISMDKNSLNKGVTDYQKDRFNTQCRILEETFRVQIIKVYYSVAILPKDDTDSLKISGPDFRDIEIEKGGKNESAENKTICDAPDRRLQKHLNKIRELRVREKDDKERQILIGKFDQLKFRVYLAESDDPEHEESINSKPSVDITFKADQKEKGKAISFDTEVIKVDLRWNADGVPKFQEIAKENEKTATPC